MFRKNMANAKKVSKVCALFLLVVMLFTLLPMAMVSAEGENLIKNGDFELERQADGTPQYWTVYTGSGMWQTVSGDNLYVVINADRAGYDQFVDVTPGEEYVFSADFRTYYSADEGGLCRIQFYNGDTQISTSGNGFNSSYNQLARYIPNTSNANGDNWKTFTMPLTVPQAANRVRVIVQTVGRGSNNQMNADNFVLRKAGANDNLYYNGDFEEWTVYSKWDAAFRGYQNWIDPLNGWQTEELNIVAEDGNHFRRVVSADAEIKGGKFKATQTGTGVNDNTLYALSARVRPSAPCTLNLQLWARNLSYGDIDNSTTEKTIAFTQDDVNTWKNIYIPYATPADAKSVMFEIQIKTASITMDVDDLSLIPVTTPNVYFADASLAPTTDRAKAVKAAVEYPATCENSAYLLTAIYEISADGLQMVSVNVQTLAASTSQVVYSDITIPENSMDAIYYAKSFLLDGKNCMQPVCDAAMIQ